MLRFVPIASFPVLVTGTSFSPYRFTACQVGREIHTIAKDRSYPPYIYSTFNHMLRANNVTMWSIRVEWMILIRSWSAMIFSFVKI